MFRMELGRILMVMLQDGVSMDTKDDVIGWSQYDTKDDVIGWSQYGY